MKKRFLFLILLINLWFVTGCYQSSIIDDAEQVERLDQSEKTEIVFWHTYSDEETRVFENELLPLFHKEYPSIQVKAVRMAHTKELKTSLIARATSRKTPDVVRMDIAWVPEFTAKGLLYQLSRFPDFPQVEERLHSVALDTAKYKGEYYGIPLNLNTKVAIYNQALLTKAGYQSPPTTIEELIELSQDNRLVIGMSGVDPWASLPYFYALGGRMTNDSYTMASGYLNSATSIQAVERLLELHRLKILGPDMFSVTNDRWGDILNGNMLMMDDGPWFYSILQNSKTVGEDVIKRTIAAPFPFNNGAASILGGEDLVILNGSKHVEESWIFMKWMTEKEAQFRMYKTGMIPANLEAANALDSLMESSYIKAYVQGLDHAFLRPPVKNWEDIEKVYTYYFKEIFIGGKDVKQSLDEAATIMDQLLNIENPIERNKLELEFIFE